MKKSPTLKSLLFGTGISLSSISCGAGSLDSIFDDVNNLNIYLDSSTAGIQLQGASEISQEYNADLSISANSNSVDVEIENLYPTQGIGILVLSVDDTIQDSINIPFSEAANGDLKARFNPQYPSSGKHEVTVTLYDQQGNYINANTREVDVKNIP